MDQRIGKILRYLADLKSILLAFGIFNFIIIYKMDLQITFTCAACPWYHPWSNLNEPSILLVATLLLRLNCWWSNTASLLLTSYLIGYFVHALMRLDDPLTALWYDWKIIRMYYPFLVGSWDSQYLFALVVFGYALLSLRRNLWSR